MPLPDPLPRRYTYGVLLPLAFVLVAPALADPSESPVEEEPLPVCAAEEATAALHEGMRLQRARESDRALAAYRRCLAAEPGCVPCVYEMGWSHAAKRGWRDAARLWERVLEMQPGHEEATLWLPRARKRARSGSTNDIEPIRVPLGTRSLPSDAPVSLVLVARFRNWPLEDPGEEDRADPQVFSPKAVRFSPDGEKAWVNSLEGYRTLVYDPRTRERIGSIRHAFDEGDALRFIGPAAPFDYAVPDPPGVAGANRFLGKPVEIGLSHGGRFLWIPYYRRSWDRWGAAPSAVAVVNAATDTIVRVIPTGPIPKYVAASPDGKRVAVVHWGDNTVGLLDTSSGDPAAFRYVAHLVVEERLPLDGLAGVDRDRECGFCLRGAVFTSDGTRLLVARMGGGGIAGFDVASGRYLGTVLGMKPTPRHLVLSPDGRVLYVGSNLAGFVSRIPVATVLSALEEAGGKRVRIRGFREAEVGSGTRTIELSPDGRFVFAAVHGDAEIAVVETASMRVVARVRTDAYPVGLDVASDGGEIWVTAQGQDGVGGNSVSVYAVRGRGSEPSP